MGRVKVAMEPMKDRKKRNETFLRRKQAMIKKALELTTLCDVNVSMIIYDHPHETPQIFPSDLDKFNSSINLYRMYRCADRGRIKSYDLSGFFNDRKAKIEGELEKAKKKKLETKYPTWFDFLDDASAESLRDFASGLGERIDHVKNQIEFLKKTSIIQNLHENNRPIDCNNYGSLPIGFIGDQNQYQNDTMSMQYYFSNPNLVNANTMLRSDGYDNSYPPMPMNDNIINSDLGELLTPGSMMGVLMSEDDNFNSQTPLPDFCFQSEMLQQQSNGFWISEFGSSQVMGVQCRSNKWHTDYENSWFN